MENPLESKHRQPYSVDTSFDSSEGVWCREEGPTRSGFQRCVTGRKVAFGQSFPLDVKELLVNNVCLTTSKLGLEFPYTRLDVDFFPLQRFHTKARFMQVSLFFWLRNRTTDKIPYRWSFPSLVVCFNHRITANSVKRFSNQVGICFKPQLPGFSPFSLCLRNAGAKAGEPTGPLFCPKHLRGKTIPTTGRAWAKHLKASKA